MGRGGGSDEEGAVTGAGTAGSEASSVAAAPLDPSVCDIALSVNDERAGDGESGSDSRADAGREAAMTRAWQLDAVSWSSGSSASCSHSPLTPPIASIPLICMQRCNWHRGAMLTRCTLRQQQLASEGREAEISDVSGWKRSRQRGREQTSRSGARREGSRGRRSNQRDSKWND